MKTQTEDKAWETYLYKNWWHDRCSQWCEHHTSHLWTQWSSLFFSEERTWLQMKHLELSHSLKSWFQTTLVVIVQLLNHKCKSQHHESRFCFIHSIPKSRSREKLFYIVNLDLDIVPHGKNKHKIKIALNCGMTCIDPL